ncbi:hypothetical protein Esti_005565 [Eimeria stiedai]
MDELPRKPWEGEIVLRLRAIVAANYKLGNSNSSHSSSSSSIILSDFLPASASHRSPCTDAGDEGTLESSTSSNNNGSSSSSGRSETLRSLPPPRLFLGEVVGLGESVQGVSLGAPMLTLPGLGPQEQYQGSLLYCLFPACAPLPNLLVNRLLLDPDLDEQEQQQQLCAQQEIQQQEQQLQQQRQLEQHEYHALGKLLARVPHLMEGLQCCTLRLRPREGDLLGICCSSVEEVADLLFWLVTFNVQIFLFTDKQDVATLDSLLSSSMPLQLLQKRGKSISLRPLTQGLEAQALRASGGYGLTHLLVTPTAAALLQQRLQQQQQESYLDGDGSIHSSSRSSDVEGGISSKGSSRSLMSLLLLCLAPGGIVCSGNILEGLDEKEASVLLAKSGGFVCFNPALLAATQAGSQLQKQKTLQEKKPAFGYFLIETLMALKEHPQMHKATEGREEPICCDVQQAREAAVAAAAAWRFAWGTLEQRCCSSSCSKNRRSPFACGSQREAPSTQMDLSIHSADARCMQSRKYLRLLLQQQQQQQSCTGRPSCTCCCSHSSCAAAAKALGTRRQHQQCCSSSSNNNSIYSSSNSTIIIISSSNSTIIIISSSSSSV